MSGWHLINISTVGIHLRVLVLFALCLTSADGFGILDLIDLSDGQHFRESKFKTPTPVFLATESNYTYHKGERAILYCSIKNLGTKVVSWRRGNETAFLTVGKITLAEDQRYEVGHIDDSPDWNLMITNVTVNDTGPYECQISSIDRDLRKEVYLHVKDELSYGQPQISISGKLHIDRGDEIRLVCNASGASYPPVAIDWFNNGIKVLPDQSKGIELLKSVSINSRTITSILVKARSEMTDTGTYVCRTSDLQVTSVKVNILSTDKKSRRREQMQSGVPSPYNSASSLINLPCFVSVCVYVSYAISIFNTHFNRR